MRAGSTTSLCAVLAVSGGLLLGCGGDSATVVTDTPASAVSVAESLLGADLLPSDGVVASANVLGADDLPPDASALGSDDLPPAS